jgi:hypothetical protein
MSAKYDIRRPFDNHCGTLLFMAPELVKDRDYNKVKNDNVTDRVLISGH